MLRYSINESMTLVFTGRPERLRGMRVSRNFSDVVYMAQDDVEKILMPYRWWCIRIVDQNGRIREPWRDC